MIKDTRKFSKRRLNKKRRLITPSVELGIIDVRSRFNVGAMFRTADAVGISKIYLMGYTPAPPHKEIEKVSLGSELTVPFEIKRKYMTFLRSLKKRGFDIIAIETGKGSIPYYQFRKNSKKVLLLVGNEVSGINKSVIRLCSQKIKIPMNGVKESLNVGIAFGIVAYRIAFP